MSALRVFPDKPCARPGCEKVITRRRLPCGRLMSPDVFLRQRFCSIACGNWKANVSKRMHGLRAQPYRKDHCEDCGITEADAILHVHHVDGDYRNDDPTNYRTLCAKRRDNQESCHDRRHGRCTWFGQNQQEKRRVKGWARQRRRGRAA